MRHFLGILATAGLVVFGSGVASAQGLDVRVGVGDRGPGMRVVRDEYRPAHRHHVIERRVIERPARSRTVCRTVVREHVRPSGVVVRRPTEVCRQVVGSRRVYVD
ncbi:hypothetical protein [Microvirga rosea]|uniref:hypothetical protein n=1 Tax=Microvirga rosea TaxID=2715425 RepID=UPI001D0B071E|nr:hypothetical protein [Microvirga rosea]MCB8819132.1 hypothetical protein [Microvirga rosea]